MQMVVATRNPGKLREIRRLLDDAGIRVLGLPDLPGLPEVEEDGDTFAANARKKGETIARLSGLLTLADDSGLTVEALGGEPGIRSARYAGPAADDAANNRKLLTALQGVPPERRGAAFVCVMALCRPDGDCHFFEGRLAGTIVDAARGGEGFGYDPLFLVPAFACTLAELPIEVKNRVSHRGQALRQVVEFLRRPGK